MELNFWALALCFLTFQPIDIYSLECVIWEAENGTGIEDMMCSTIEESNRTLGEILRSARVFSSPRDCIGRLPGAVMCWRNATGRDFEATLPSKVTNQLRLSINGNLTITDQWLNGFTNIKHLNIEKSSSGIRSISIAPTAFQHTPNLQRIRISYDFHLPKETIQALGGLKNRLTGLTLKGCLPNDDVMALFRNCTKLNDFYMVRYHDDGTSCHPDIFQGSAATLQTIHIQGCSMSHLPAAMFRNLTALTKLSMHACGIETIEAGAFDQLTNLTSISMFHNNIRRLPDGIFKHNKKLKRVDFALNGLRNLNVGNFSHCENFKELCAGNEQCFMYDD